MVSLPAGDHLAVENGGAWYSADRGFARFRSLRGVHPLDAGE